MITTPKYTELTTQNVPAAGPATGASPTDVTPPSVPHAKSNAIALLCSVITDFSNVLTILEQLYQIQMNQNLDATQKLAKTVTATSDLAFNLRKIQSDLDELVAKIKPKDEKGDLDPGALKYLLDAGISMSPPGTSSSSGAAAIPKNPFDDDTMQKQFVATFPKDEQSYYSNSDHWNSAVEADYDAFVAAKKVAASRSEYAAGKKTGNEIYQLFLHHSSDEARARFDTKNATLNDINHQQLFTDYLKNGIPPDVAKRAGVDATGTGTPSSGTDTEPAKDKEADYTMRDYLTDIHKPDGIGLDQTQAQRMATAVNTKVDQLTNSNSDNNTLMQKLLGFYKNYAEGKSSLVKTMIDIISTIFSNSR